jgi:hypothetical protein
MSDLAKKLIAESKRTLATFLDLGNCGMTEIPEEIGDLVWLESLLLSQNASRRSIRTAVGSACISARYACSSASVT